VLFCSLSQWNARESSATWDEPQSFAAGAAMLLLNDYRLDIEHPPLLRKWAALPLLWQQDVKLDTTSPDWLRGETWRWAPKFLFQLNDGDHLLVRGRFMIALLGVLLGALLFCWVEELFGFRPAVAVLAMYTFEPNILAHASLTTTDFGVTCFMFATLYGLWRATQKLTLVNGLATAVGFALAVMSKFSALLLLPMMVVLLAVRVFGREGWAYRLGQSGEWRSRSNKAMAAAGVLLVVLVVAYVGTWAAYGFHYEPSGPDQSAVHFRSNPELAKGVPTLSRIVTWVDEHHLLPNACSQGFLGGQGKAQSRAAYLAGEQRATGWWYFFPAAIALKTPLMLLLLALGGIGLAAASVRRSPWALFVLVPLTLYLSTAMAGRLNIGLRHVLPIYPYLFLAAGAVVAWALPRGGAKVLWLLAPLFVVAEVVAVAPHWLAFFNTLIGGPEHGHEYLVDSNLDWGQDLKGLKRWMDAQGVQQINLAYFGSADPRYYGINAISLPGMGEKTQMPQLPGWVAVSATTLHGVYQGERTKAFYAPLLARAPDAMIGYSIFVYRMESPWWTDQRTTARPDQAP
jgi:hypothetical protein